MPVFHCGAGMQVMKLLLVPHAQACTPGLLLWSVEARIMTEAQPQGTRVDSGYITVNGSKYQGSVVYDALGGELAEPWLPFPLCSAVSLLQSQYLSNMHSCMHAS